MENMARDKGETISIQPKQGKTKLAEETPVRFQKTEPTDQKIPKSSDLFSCQIPQ